MAAGDRSNKLCFAYPLKVKKTPYKWGESRNMNYILSVTSGPTCHFESNLLLHYNNFKIFHCPKFRMLGALSKGPLW